MMAMKSHQHHNLLAVLRFLYCISNLETLREVEFPCYKNNTPVVYPKENTRKPYRSRPQSLPNVPCTLNENLGYKVVVQFPRRWELGNHYSWAHCQTKLIAKMPEKNIYTPENSHGTLKKSPQLKRKIIFQTSMFIFGGVFLGLASC